MQLKKLFKLSLPLCLSICLSVSPSLCLSACLPTIRPYICFSACLSICLSFCLSVCLSVFLLACHPSFYLYICLSVWLPFVHPSTVSTGFTYDGHLYYFQNILQYRPQLSTLGAYPPYKPLALSTSLKKNSPEKNGLAYYLVSDMNDNDVDVWTDALDNAVDCRRSLGQML